MFLGAIAVLDRLVASPEQAVLISHMSASVKQMEAVAQILLRRVDTESKYLARLEGMSFQKFGEHPALVHQATMLVQCALLPGRGADECHGDIPAARASLKHDTSEVCCEGYSVRCQEGRNSAKNHLSSACGI